MGHYTSVSEWVSKYRFYALSVSKAIFRARMTITWWIKLWGNLPLGHDALLFSARDSLYAQWQTRLDIPIPLITQSHRHGWTYQGLWLPSHTDTAGHTKAFDYPVTQTRLDIQRPLITQPHRHGWTYQGLWLPSHTDTAGHTKAFDYPATQTRLDIPRPLITQPHRHGWTYKGLWLPSHTDTAGHTKAFDYPVTQTRLDIPRPLITQSHRHGWTYKGLWLPQSWGKSRLSVVQLQGGGELTTCRSTAKHVNHYPTKTPSFYDDLCKIGSVYTLTFHRAVLEQLHANNPWSLCVDTGRQIPMDNEWSKLITCHSVDVSCLAWTYCSN